MPFQNCCRLYHFCEQNTTSLCAFCFLLRLFFIMYDDEGHYCWGSLEEEIEEEEDESNYSMFICEYRVKM